MEKFLRIVIFYFVRSGIIQNMRKNIITSILRDILNTQFPGTTIPRLPANRFIFTGICERAGFQRRISRS
jgi:hypothetical protein